MLKIKDDVDLKELEKKGFYFEGNTYQKDVGKGKLLSICCIDRKIYEPKLRKWDFKIYQAIKNIIFMLALDGLVEKVEE